MAVDVERVATTYGEEVRRIRTKTLLVLHENFVEHLKANPGDRDEILAELRRLRAEFDEAGHEELEDLVLDAMDMLTGWVRPEMRV